MRTNAINVAAETIRPTRTPNPVHPVLAAPGSLVGGESRKTKTKTGVTTPRSKKKKKAKARIGTGTEIETETGTEIETETETETEIETETETETETAKSAPRVPARKSLRETRAKREKSGLTGPRRTRVREVRRKIRVGKPWCRPSISAVWAAVEMHRRPKLPLEASAPQNPPAEHLFPHLAGAISTGPSSPTRKRLSHESNG
jgi:hypothetical protein